MPKDYEVTGSCRHNSPIWLALVEEELPNEWVLSLEYSCGCSRREVAPAGTYRVIDLSGRPAPIYRRWEPGG